MYTISTMEAAMRPLGIVFNASCGLLPFINWIRTARDIDYRFGLIQSVRICYRKYKVNKPQHRHHIYAPSCDDPVGVCQFLHVGLLNGRGIENWLEIEVIGTSSCVEIFGHNFFSLGLTLITNSQKHKGRYFLRRRARLWFATPPSPTAFSSCNKHTLWWIW
jgi:hypothetical protein